MSKPTDDIGSTRKAVLSEAERLVLSDRNNSYGPPHQDFARTADMMTALMGHKLTEGERFEAYEVAELLMLVKLSRVQWSPGKQDHWVDIAGYAACGAEAYELGAGAPNPEMGVTTDG